MLLINRLMGKVSSNICPRKRTMKSITKISVIMGVLLLASFELVVVADETEKSRADTLIAKLGEMPPRDRIDEYLKYLKPNILDSAERQKVIRAFASSAQFLSPMYGRSSKKMNWRQRTTQLSECAKAYPNDKGIILTLTRMLIHQKRYKEALKIITPFYMSSPCHEATAWHDYAIYKIDGLTPSCNLMLEKMPEFDIHFCVITKNPKAHQKATLKQLKREVDILNKNFRTLQNKQIIRFKFKSAHFYDEVKDLGCKFVELGDAKTYDTHKYAEVFNKCTHSKVRDRKAINFYVYDSYSKASGYGDNGCHGKRNSNRPYLLIDWTRLNCNVQSPEAHEMGHAFGLGHVSVLGARWRSSTNIMCSTEHRFGSGGKRDLGFTEAQTAIILYHATRTSHRQKQDSRHIDKVSD